MTNATAETDGDAIVLLPCQSLRTLVMFYITHPPDMAVGIVVREFDKLIPIRVHGALGGDRADSAANLGRERHIFLSSTTRYEV
jgi:hypothetical protein